MTLESKLTEEEKSKTLKELNFNRKKWLIGELVRFTMEDACMQNDKALEICYSRLDVLAHFDLRRFEKRFEMGISRPLNSERIRRAAASCILGLAEKDWGLYLKCYKKCTVDYAYHPEVVEEAEKTMDFVKEVFEAINLERKGSQFPSAEQRYQLLINQETLNPDELSSVLDEIAESNPDLFVELCDENMLERKNPSLLLGFAKSLHHLPALKMLSYDLWWRNHLELDPHSDLSTWIAFSTRGLVDVDYNKFLDLTQKAEEHIEPSVRHYGVLAYIGVAKKYPEKFMEAYSNVKKYIEKHGSSEVTTQIAAIAKCVEGLSESDPELYIKLCEEQLKSREVNYMHPTGAILAPMANIDMEKFLQLFHYSFNHGGDREQTARSFWELMQDWWSGDVPTVEDKFYRFVEKLLDSDYVENDKDARIKINALPKFNVDYNPVSKILETGDCKNIEEMLECAKREVPGYTIIGKLGMGGSGDVYHAVDDFSGTDVKIKVFRENQKSSMRVAREKEGRSVDDVVRGMMTKLRSRISDFTNICQVYHGGSTDDGRIFVAGEYVEEGAIEEEVGGEYKIREDISGKVVFDVFEKILDGMQVIHNAGMVWKDVKLRNVLVSKDRSKVKIDDLEMLSGLDELVQDPRYSKASERYAAPEVMQDPTQARVASDIYSAGVCLFVMCTRDPEIISGISRMKDENKYYEKLVETFKQYDFRDLDLVDLEGLNLKLYLLHTLAYNQNERQQNIEEVREELKSFSPLRTIRTSSFWPMRDFSNRYDMDMFLFHKNVSMNNKLKRTKVRYDPFLEFHDPQRSSRQYDDSLSPAFRNAALGVINDHASKLSEYLSSVEGLNGRIKVENDT